MRFQKGLRNLRAVLLAVTALSVGTAALAQKREATATEQAAMDRANTAFRAKDYATVRTILASPELAEFAEAHFALANMNRQGIGGPKDEAAANAALRRAAELKHPDAMFNLYQNAAKLGTPAGKAEAHKWLVALAETGEAAGLALLGESYAAGTLTPPDRDKAVQYLQAAASKGWPSARENLGRVYYDMGKFDLAVAELSKGGPGGYGCLALMYSKGQGAPRDDVNARWFAHEATMNGAGLDCLIQAAAAGNSVAAYRLASDVLDQRDQQPAPAEIAPAIARLEVAASQGHIKANDLLGRIYFEGKIVPRDPARAYQYASKAAGVVEDSAYRAGVLLARGEGVTADGKKADAWLRRADINEDAIYERALLYANGSGGIARNLARAAELMGDAHNLSHPAALSWLQQRANAGDVDAMIELGDIHRNGTGETEENLSTARSWYQRAVDKGSAKGLGRLGYVLHEEGKYDAARAQWKKAADRGDPEAMGAYGDDLYRSRGMAKDEAGRQQGWNLMVRSAEAGNINSMRQLIDFAGINGAFDKANRAVHLQAQLKWASAAYNAGEDEMAETLGDLFATSYPTVPGVTDFPRAADMYRRYLRLKRTDDVMAKLAALYADGSIGLDRPKAWLLYAMPNLMYYGKPPGAKADELAKKMTPDENQRAQRLLRACEGNDWYDCY